MKRSLTVAIALAMVATCALLMKSDSKVEAQNHVRVMADTGVISLGPDQELRLTLLSGTPTANGSFSFRVRQMIYEQESCVGGICKQSIASQSESNPIQLMPGEAASVTVDPSDPNVIYVRAVVVANSRDMRVNAMVIDKLTGDLVSYATTDLVIDVSG